MPIEIKELIIEGNLVSNEEPDADAVKLLTQKDFEKLKEEIMGGGGGGLSPTARRELMADILREVRKMLDDSWRR